MPYSPFSARMARGSVSLLVAASLAACAGADTTEVITPEPPGAGVVLSVSPAQTQVSVGGTAQLSASLRDAHGRAVSAVNVSWRSLDPAVAEVAGGVVTGRGAGQTRVVATANGMADTATVVVVPAPAPVAAVTIELGELTLRPGTSGQLGATARDAAGAPLAGRPITWTSDAPGVATVSAGLVTAVATGTARVIASVEGRADTAIVTVATLGGGTPGVITRVTLTPEQATVQPGRTAQLTASAWDASGSLVASASISWRSVDAGVATVSASGVVTGVAIGQTRVIASSGEHADTAEVTVAPTPVAELLLTSTFGPLQPGATGQLVATARDAFGNALSGREVTFRSSDPNVATVSASGLVTAVSVGTVTMTATSEGVSGQAVVQVVNAPVVVGSVTVAPTSVMLDPGATKTVVATVKDAAGATLASYPVSWTSANASVAKVSASGVVTAVASGSTTITASAGGRSATVAVTVSSPPPPTPVTVSSQADEVGVVAGRDGGQFLLPDVLLAGEDEASQLVPLQGFATYSLAAAPAGSTVESATLTITMDASGVWGDPFGLGALFVERATQIALNTTTPGAGSIEVTKTLRTTVTVDVTALVHAARVAGDDEITFRLRFAKDRDNDGQTDQLELSAGTLRVTYLK